MTANASSLPARMSATSCSSERSRNSGEERRGRRLSPGAWTAEASMERFWELNQDRRGKLCRSSRRVPRLARQDHPGDLALDDDLWLDRDDLAAVDRGQQGVRGVEPRQGLERLDGGKHEHEVAGR